MEGTALLNPDLGRHPAPTRLLAGWCRFKPIATAGARMAGMPLFAHVGREKLTPPPRSAALKLIKFCGSKTPKSLFEVPRRRTGLVFARFAPQNRQKREESRGFVRFFLRLCQCVGGFREKLTHRLSELTKFPMPVAPV